MPRVNPLIADDVGLGKTIEAGLLIQEPLLRHRARTVLVVCPASLTVKRQEEMHSRFGLEFRIADSSDSCQAIDLPMVRWTCLLFRKIKQSQQRSINQHRHQ